jgi:two-component system response regulator HydG
MPPLRERPEDVPPLATHFLKRFALRLRRQVTGFSPGAMELLTHYAWPGNVRELANAVERATNLASGQVITEADLPAALTVLASPLPPPRRQAVGGSGSSATSSSAGAASALGDAGDEERERLIAALNETRWNQRRAAEQLGMSRTTLWRKMREHRIES